MWFWAKFSLVRVRRKQALYNQLLVCSCVVDSRQPYDNPARSAAGRCSHSNRAGYAEIVPKRLVSVRHYRSHRIKRDDVSRSEEHTSELQSQSNLVCRLLLEKKKKNH